MSLTIARSTVTAWRDLPSSVWLLVARPRRQPAGRLHPAVPVRDAGGGAARLGGPGGLPDGRLRRRHHPLPAAGRAARGPRGARGRPSPVGLVATAVAQLMVAGAQSLAQATVAVVLLGLAFEVYEPPSQSLVADATTAEDRPVAFGLLFAALSAAGMGAGILAAAAGGGRPALAVRRRRRDRPGLRGRRVAAAAAGDRRCAPEPGAPGPALAGPPVVGPARPRHGLRGGLPPGRDHPAAHGDRPRPAGDGRRAAADRVGGDRGARPTRHARGPAAPPGRPGRARGRLRGPGDRPAADGTAPRPCRRSSRPPSCGAWATCC